MRKIASRNNRRLRKTTAVALLPFLMAQVLIGGFCAPQTLRAGTEQFRKMTWEELPGFLNGEKKVTVSLAEGGAVRGDVLAVLPGNIHLHRVTMATDWKHAAFDSETSIPRDSVKEIRVERMRSSVRIAGAVLGGVGGFFLVPLALVGPTIGESASEANLLYGGLVGGAIGGSVIGYQLGKRRDRETIIITIVD